MTPPPTPGLRILIAIPVLGRPHRVGPLVENIAATTVVPHRVVFVCSMDDEEQLAACNDSGADVMVASWDPGWADYSKKINLAYRDSTEEWILCGADDLVFHPGWDEQAIRFGETRNAGVVGTQDRANPLVIKGRQSTHPLVSRAYIEQHGGTFDNTGEVYCELYSHQWVDIELVETAKARHAWAFCHNSVVEHHHPHFGKGEMDDTYLKAVRDTHEDMVLFQRRMREMKQQGRKRRRAALY